MLPRRINVFEITPDGEIVWDFANPYKTNGESHGHPVLNPQVCRAQAVSYEWGPEGTPHAEKAITAPLLSQFRSPAAK
ncbi:hypothetical protein CCR94_06900 [Rhodoblastus sphagnicola]|uniref:Uncharacterized protein n=1 Tax=Rhodoblastus sphagnicola TaxID=333368 RepID=A0A2S6NC19_9HYPH|nr:hypothetical protein CCR94_06900 [Rhodoblastus sphagnicola]